MRIVYSDKCVKSAKKLPLQQQEKLAQLLEAVTANPFAPQLHSKKLTGQLTGFYSFRITRDWRVIFQFIDPTTIRLVDVANRREIYR